MSLRRNLYIRRRCIAFLFGAVGLLFLIYSRASKPATSDEIKAGNPVESELIDWEDYEYYKKDHERVGHGENGVAFQLPAGDDVERKKEQLYKTNGFNALVSDYIALNRSVPDVRHPLCRGRLYHSTLPSASVIIPFHNEHYSVLLRTVYSIVNRSPSKLLKEIVLTDDFSSKEELKQNLDKYVQAHWPNLVKVVRTKKREGLIRARLIGARAASGEVLVFLDAHSECNYNWLPPLLEPILMNYRTVVCPFVDVIEQDDFQYKIQDSGARGSFDWQFYYKRLSLLPEDKMHRDRNFKNPVMAGGYFAISAKWFWELGGYDEGLEIWGGEQYELSFKIWQCGGELIDTPCSHVGHIYRKFSPNTNPGDGDHVGRNYKRVAEVWMDEYKQYLYMRSPRYKNLDVGDLSKQKELRKRLKCKSFKWFMEEVAFDQPKKYPLIEPANLLEGQIRNVKSGLCIDTKFKHQMETFGLSKCIASDSNVNGEQSFLYTAQKEIKPKRRDVCFDVPHNENGTPVILYTCHKMGGNQMWEFNAETGLLKHEVTDMCLEAVSSRKELVMHPCDPNNELQLWIFKKFN